MKKGLQGVLEDQAQLQALPDNAFEQLRATVLFGNEELSDRDTFIRLLDREAERRKERHSAPLTLTTIKEEQENIPALVNMYKKMYKR